MERIDKIMEQMGFKKDAEDGVKAAFVKNLIKQAYGVDVPLPAHYEAQLKVPVLEDLSADILAGRPLPGKKEKPVQAQMSFDFEKQDLEKPKVG